MHASSGPPPDSFAIICLVISCNSYYGERVVIYFVCVYDIYVCIYICIYISLSIMYEYCEYILLVHFLVIICYCNFFFVRVVKLLF